MLRRSILIPETAGSAEGTAAADSEDSDRDDDDDASDAGAGLEMEAEVTGREEVEGRVEGSESDRAVGREDCGR